MYLLQYGNHYEEELDDMLQNYIKKLSKSELQEALLQVLYDGPEWQFDKFINEYIVSL